MSGTLHEDLSTFILLEALRNILYLDNRAKRTRSWVSVARLKGFFFISDSYVQVTQRYKWKALLCFHNNSG